MVYTVASIDTGTQLECIDSNLESLSGRHISQARASRVGRVSTSRFFSLLPLPVGASVHQMPFSRGCRNRRSPKKLARRMSSKTTRHLSRRKGSARARNPKKLRGGVTTRRRLSQLRQQELSTALRLLPADVVKQIGKRHPLLL